MRQQWFTHVRLLIAHPPRYSETSTAALTTPALDRRSLRWFGVSACTATPEDLPPSLAQHGSCRRSSTSSSLPFRTHVGAGNSAVVVDLPRCAAILSSRVPRHLPLVRLAVRLHHSQDLEIIVLPPTRCVAPAGRPAWAHRRRRELARRGCGRARATEPSRAACHPRHAAASAAAPRRLTLHPNTATAGPTIDLSGASPTHAAPRSRVSDLGLPPHPRRTERARPSHRCVQGPADPQQRPNRPRTHTLQSDLVAVPAVACDFATIETVTLRRFYLLLFIDIATRSVYFAGITGHPAGVWASQAALNLLLQNGHQLADAGALVRDRASPVHRRLRRDLHNRTHQGPQDTRAHARGERVRPTLDPHPSDASSPTAP